MATGDLRVKCQICSVTGIRSPGGPGAQSETCMKCAGTGYAVLGYVEELSDKLTDILDKLDDIDEKL